MENKPLISFILITYNQENFVRDALDGAFAQTYSPMEIIIADDGSKDNTPKVIEEYIAGYKGPHKVLFQHNEKNVGIAQNVNNAMALAKGEYFILAAGDDKSLPERAQRTYEVFAQYPEMTCMNFSSVYCNSKLEPYTQAKDTINKQRISSINIYDYCEFESFVIWSGDTRSIRRSLFDTFGPLTKGKDEDSAYFFRGLLIGNVGHSPEQLSLRRMHSQQASNVQNIRKHISEDFIAQPILDTKNAFDMGLISQKVCNLYIRKINQADRTLADLYYGVTSVWYRYIYSKPSSLLKLIKNKLFK
jgi:glycosyltransferase involved in cell wall biosynthesis